jgi:Ca2+-binding RTX toxin-like protein
VTPIDHISFDDPDSNTGPVWVTFTMNDNDDALDATNLSGSGVSVVSGNGSSQIKLAGTIADINSYLFHGNLLWNPDGFSDHEGGLLTVRIDDNGSAPGGNVTTATVGISEISDPNFSGSATQNFFDVNFTQIGTVNAGNGNDTVTTSWSHQGATSIYDGGTGSDTIHLEFTPDQLSEILSSLALRSELRSYIDDPSGDTLDLSNSSWHAEAKNFEHADVNLITDSGSDDISVNSFFTNLPFAGSPTSGNDLILGTSGNDSTLGGASGSPGNDIVVGLGGNDTISGGSGNDLLLGGTGNDILVGGTGNDVLSGSGGADVFRFTELTAGGAPNFGKDIIVDFHPGEDSIEIDPSIFADFAALKAVLADDSHGNAVITANAANTITLEDVSAATLIAHQNDIHFGAILSL